MNYFPLNRLYTLVLFFLLGLFPGLGSADMGLVNLLTSNLGVTEQQASGGAGAIFGLAKERMSNDEFSQIKEAVPGVDSLIESAPNPESTGSSVSSVTSLLGSTGGSLGALGSLTGSFSQLGMGTDMITQFTPIIYDYVKQKGGDAAMGLLKNAIQ